MAFFNTLNNEDYIKRIKGKLEKHKKLSGKEESVLADIAKGYLDIKWDAVEILTDDNFLFDVVQNAADAKIQSFAVKKMTDQPKLFEISQKHRDLYIRKDAVSMLTDQDMLMDIANSNVRGVSDDAILRLKDENALMSLAKKGNKIAIKILKSDQVLMKELALGGSQEATDMLDKSLLENIKQELPLSVRGSVCNTLGHEWRVLHECADTNMSCKKCDYCEKEEHTWIIEKSIDKGNSGASYEIGQERFFTCKHCSAEKSELITNEELRLEAIRDRYNNMTLKEQEAEKDKFYNGK